jgi:hypothetical protein
MMNRRAPKEKRTTEAQRSQRRRLGSEKTAPFLNPGVAVAFSVPSVSLW